MANSRAKGKSQLNAWVPDAIYAEVERRSKLTGQPRSKIVEEMIVEGMRKHGIRVEDEK